MKTWMDGTWTENATVPLVAHALHYGSGVFEGIRSYATSRGPELFKLREHLDRFGRGAKVLGIEFDRDALDAACRDVVRVNEFGDAYVRPIAFHGEGSLGLDVGKQAVHVAVVALKWDSHLGCEAAEHGVRCTVAGRRRNPAEAIPPLKLTGGYVNAILAKREAAKAGFQEAIFVDENDHVVEATGENVFAVIDGGLIAVAHPDALPGITRSVVIELGDAKVRRVRRAELLAADEVFLTGTSAEVTPVSQIDERRFEAGPVTRRLQRLYGSVVRGQTASVGGR